MSADQIPRDFMRQVHVATVQWETFKEENFHGQVRSDHFAEKLLLNAKPIIGGYGTPKFRGEIKAFVDGSKTAKFVNVFSLKSFPLYGIPLYHQRSDSNKWGIFT